jgi:hypothetical protein
MITTKSNRSTVLRSLVAAALAAAALVAVAPNEIAKWPAAEAQAPATLGAGGEYHPVTPARIFDSRQAGGPRPTTAQGASFDVDLLGRGGVPTEAGSVLAVVANVTVADPTAAGYLSISPTGSNAGVSSLVNFNIGENVPNLAIVGVGVGGKASITLVTPAGAGTANVLVDVFGWISTSGYVDAADTGGRFVPVGPSRVLDTRSVPVPAGWPSAKPLGRSEQLTLPIRGANGLVPNSSNVTGVMVNITAVNDAPGNAATFISATPEPTPTGVEPATSVTNVNAGQVKANMAIVPVGADGNIRLYNSRGATHLIVDVLGYLERGVVETSRAGRVIPLDAPFRVFDTRQAAFGSAPLGFATKEDWSFRAFAGSVTLNGTPIGNQSALIGNLTGTDLAPLRAGASVTTYLTMYPGSGSPPNVSNINVTPGRSVPNMSLLRYGNVGDDPYTIAAFNFDGTLHYLLDVYAVVLAD